MIPISLLLILVAVALLALGLTGGSSGLLIGSIVASLLAAVALVIGARQNANARRAAEARRDLPADEPAGVRVASPADQPTGEIPVVDQDDFDPVQFMAEPAFADQAAAEPMPDLSPDPAFAAGYPSTTGQPLPEEHDLVEPDAVYPDQHDSAEPASAVAADSATSRADSSFRADSAVTETIERPADYDRAYSTINAARSEESDAWRREPEDEDEGGLVDLGLHDEDPGPHDHGGREEFAEPDPDDPDDEPLPQLVSPSDAVRLARLKAEVLVVDGRPRYHVADCPSLVGRLTEPIPVNEAVELGFSPCGLCRPVDRLVAASAQR